MYAVIETGGKQYRVEVGTELEVEHLEVQAGDAITLDRVLLVADGAEASIGRPLVADAIVSAEVLRQDRGPKLISFKYRPKARSRVKKGHRQELTVLRVTDVRLGDRSAAEDARQAAGEQAAERERLSEVAARQAAVDQELAARLAEAASTKEAADAAAAPSDATPRRGRRPAAAAGAEDAAETEGATPDDSGATAGAGDDPAPTDKPARAPRAKKET